MLVPRDKMVIRASLAPLDQRVLMDQRVPRETKVHSVHKARKEDPDQSERLAQRDQMVHQAVQVTRDNPDQLVLRA